ncbi:TPA: hypothetical protein MA022_003970 [Klebsiella pneumoniae]|nr:hypothetical protein [Klebsiella pneumoniae]
MKKILIIVPDGGMLFESAGIADILMQANRLHPEGAREICYQVKLATTQCGKRQLSKMTLLSTTLHLT